MPVAGCRAAAEGGKMELERRAESCENIPFDVGSAGGSVRACATAAPNAADGETTLGRDLMAPGFLVAGTAWPAGKLFVPAAHSGGVPCVPCAPGETGLRSRSVGATAGPPALAPGVWMGHGALDWASLLD